MIASLLSSSHSSLALFAADGPLSDFWIGVILLCFVTAVIPLIVFGVAGGFDKRCPDNRVFGDLRQGRPRR